MDSIRNAILQQVLDLELTIYQVSKMVKGKIPQRTVYTFLTGEKDMGTETASILMDTLGLKIEVDQEKTESLRAEGMEQSEPKTFLGRFKSEWEKAKKAGASNWSLREQIGMCLLIDLEFRIKGPHPAKEFRKAVDGKDYEYIKKWVRGLKFKKWK